MSQRLISTRIHPITGEEVRPLWFDQDGRAFYPVMGAAPDNDDDDEDDSDDDDNEGGDSDSEGQEKSGKDDDSQSEIARITARMKAADKRAAEAERKAKEYEDKDKSELEKATQRAAELETRMSEQETELKSLRLENAFLASNDITWHDKDVALAHADLSEVVDEDGVVDSKALKKALKALADAKPYLVKKDDSGGTDEPSGPSGVPAGSGKKGGKSKFDEEALRKKYAALNL